MHKRLWIFDFDGTLSPLVPHRDLAELLPEWRQLLQAMVDAPGNIVAVLSSRTLNDLVTRVQLPGIYLGGGSGIEWRLGDGRRKAPDREMEVRLASRRRSLLDPLQYMAEVLGADLEDKYWSVAVHTRSMPQEKKEELTACIRGWESQEGVKVFRGPEVFEVQLLPEVDKKFGVQTLCRLLGPKCRLDATLYAGDDANDAVAMRYILAMGGSVLSVGQKPLVPGTPSVPDPLGLAAAVRELAGLSIAPTARTPETPRTSPGTGEA